MLLSDIFAPANKLYIIGVVNTIDVTFGADSNCFHFICLLVQLVSVRYKTKSTHKV